MRQTRSELEYGVLNRCSSDECRSVYDRLVFESGRAVFEMGFWFLDKRSAARADATKVTCSMLVVACGADRMTPCTVVERVAARYRSISTYHRFVLAWLEIHAPPGRTATAASAAP